MPAPPAAARRPLRGERFQNTAIRCLHTRTVDPAETDETGARELLRRYLRERMLIADFRRDDWEQVAIKDPTDTVARLTEVAGISTAIASANSTPL